MWLDVKQILLVNTTKKISTIVDTGNAIVVYKYSQYDQKNFYYCRLTSPSASFRIVNTTKKISTIVDLPLLRCHSCKVNTTKKISTIVDAVHPTTGQNVNTTKKISTIVDGRKMVCVNACQYDQKNFYYCR